MTQFYDKSLYTGTVYRKFQNAKCQYKHKTKYFDLKKIVDQLKTVSYSNNRQTTSVIKQVYGIPAFPITTNAVQSKEHIFKKNVNNHPYKDRVPTVNQREEAIRIIHQRRLCPLIWKPAQVQGLKESRLTIRGDEKLEFNRFIQILCQISFNSVNQELIETLILKVDWISLC